MPEKKSVAQIAKKKPARRSRSKPPDKTPRQSRGQGAGLARQQEIVVMHDIEGLSWVEIGRRLKSNERTVREAYWRYTNDVVPLISAEQPPAVAASYLRLYEVQRQELTQIAATAKDDSNKIAARRGVVNTILQEIKLRQSLGLMPSEMANMPRVEAMKEMIGVFFSILRRLDAPVELYEEVERAALGRAADIEGTSRAVG